MTLCTITGWQCHCQPPEIPCDGLKELREAYADWRRKAEQAQRELSLAEEGLANYAQEIEAAKHDIERLTAACSAEATEVERLTAENANLRAVIDSRDQALGFEELSPHPTGDDRT